MNRKKKQTPITPFNGYFPPELLTEVLSRLRVKSLLRFRCVSKTWRNLIENPNFISMHFNRYNHRNQINHRKCSHRLTLHLERDGLSFTTRSIDTLRRSAPLIGFSKKYLQPCASIDGLVLLQHVDYYDGYDYLLLWNPSIRKSLVVPRCPVAGGWRYNVYALGFASSMDDYKVVIVQYKNTFGDPLDPLFAVYGVKDGCWRRSTRGMDVLDWKHYIMKSEPLSTRGFAFWLMGPRPIDFTRGFIIVSFDFNAEEFSLLELPGDGGEETLQFLFLLGESVALLYVFPISICIWIMNKDGGNEPWTKWYSGDISLDSYRFFKSQRPRKILFVGKSHVLLLMSNGRNGKVMRYNIRSHEIQHVVKSISVLDMYIYEESLLLCKGLEGQTLISLPRKRREGK